MRNTGLWRGEAPSFCFVTKATGSIQTSPGTERRSRSRHYVQPAHGTKHLNTFGRHRAAQSPALPHPKPHQRNYQQALLLPIPVPTFLLLFTLTSPTLRRHNNPVATPRRLAPPQLHTNSFAQCKLSLYLPFLTARRPTTPSANDTFHLCPPQSHLQAQLLISTQPSSPGFLRSTLQADGWTSNIDPTNQSDQSN